MSKLSNELLNYAFQETEKLVKGSPMDVEDGSKIFYIMDIVPGSAGSHQTEEMADKIGYEIPEGEEAIEHVDDIENEYNDIALEITSKQPKTLSGQFYFGYLESDNSYGLFYMEDEIKDENLEKSSNFKTKLIKKENSKGKQNNATWLVNIYYMDSFNEQTIKEIFNTNGKDKNKTMVAVAERFKSMVEDDKPSLQGFYSDLINGALADIDYHELSELALDLLKEED